MASSTTDETTFWQEERPFGQGVQSVTAEWEKKGWLYKSRDDDRPRPPWTHGSLDHENEVMGKHLPPQLREPRRPHTLEAQAPRPVAAGTALSALPAQPPPTSITWSSSATIGTCLSPRRSKAAVRRVTPRPTAEGTRPDRAPLVSTAGPPPNDDRREPVGSKCYDCPSRARDISALLLEREGNLYNCSTRARDTRNTST